MSNSNIDLDTLLATGDSREIFDPVTKGAWPGVTSRIYVSTHRSGPASAIQIGYDPELDKTFARAKASGEESRWGNWVAIEAPPPEAPAKAKAKADENEETETETRSKKK
jgi:hypothetical protein